MTKEVEHQVSTENTTQQLGKQENPVPLISKRRRILLVLCTIAVFTIGIAVRLYDITDEPLDFHPTRQLRGAVIARGMYYDVLPGADPETRELAISHWQSTGQYEPSILEYIVSRTYLIIGGEQVWVAKAFNSLFWLIGGITLFDLARRIAGSSKQKESSKAYTIGWLSALAVTAYYLLNPFGVQASRSFQPDPGMVMWIILAVYALFRWSEIRSWKWTILAGVFAGIAILTKAVAAYIIAGASAAIMIYTLGHEDSDPGGKFFTRLFNAIKRIILNPHVWVMIILMLLPAGLYYATRGGRASDYFTSWTVALSHLLLDPETYVRWLRLVESLMGLAVLLTALLGIVIARPRSRALLLGLWVGYVLYGLFLPYQMYTHNYYHLQLIPIIALSLVAPAVLVVTALSNQSRFWQSMGAVAAVVILLYTAWLAVLPQYTEDHRHERAYWEEIGAQIPSDGKIIGLTQDYGYPLMYYGWRKVKLWPPRGEINLAKLRGSEKDFNSYFEKRIENMKYFVVTAFKQFDDQPVLEETLYERYPVLIDSQGILIFDLSNPYSTADP